jgi:hypothetical protein
MATTSYEISGMDLPDPVYGFRTLSDESKSFPAIFRRARWVAYWSYLPARFKLKAFVGPDIGSKQIKSRSAGGVHDRDGVLWPVQKRNPFLDAFYDKRRTAALAWLQAPENIIERDARERLRRRVLVGLVSPVGTSVLDST